MFDQCLFVAVLPRVHLDYAETKLGSTRMHCCSLATARRPEKVDCAGQLGKRCTNFAPALARIRGVFAGIVAVVIAVVITVRRLNINPAPPSHHWSVVIRGLCLRAPTLE